MKRLAFVAALVTCVVAPALAQKTETVLRIGDKVRVAVLGHEELVGEYVVASDGTLSGIGFSRVPANGRTLDQVREAITTEIAKMLRSPVVYVYPVAQEPEWVFVAGIRLKEGAGRLRFDPTLDIRRVLAAVDLPERTERIEGLLYRKGEMIQRFNVRQALIEQKSTVGPFAAGDVIVFTPIATIKVWFGQGVNKQGETELEVGTTLTQGLAAAQGAKITSPGSDNALAPLLEKRNKVLVRRGDQVTEIPLIDQEALSKFVLQPGDTITVRAATLISVTVDGQVNLPGNFALPEGVDMNDAIVQAKGPAGDGTLRRVYLYRKGEVRVIDVSTLRQGKIAPSVPLEDGDLVVVPRNERAVFVMGEVRGGGRFLMPEDRDLTAVDALAFAGGLGGRGSYRRMLILRADETGKMKPIEFNLDEYLKDGKKASNPVLEPGDVLFVQSPKGIDTNAVIQLVSTTILLQSLVGR